MRHLAWVSLGSFLIAGTCFAGWIDQREAPVMLDLLQKSGARTQVDSAGNNHVGVTSITCVHSYPIDPSTSGATENSVCSYTDIASGKALASSDEGAKLFIELAGHFGGSLNQNDQDGIRYQNFTASWVKCEKDTGPDEPWLCEVSDQ